MTDQTHTIPAFLESELSPASTGQPDQPLFHVIPVPYEKTVSYGTGTAAGPAAILQASQQLEAFDGTAVPASRGIRTLAPINCADNNAETILARIADAVGAALDQQSVPILLGGEHTVTLGAAQALSRRPQPVGIVQFDAHADLRDAYEGTRFSHACVMRRVLECNIPLFQVGVRSLSLDEHEFRRKHAVPHMDAVDLVQQQAPYCKLPENFPEAVYVTFDVDAFDASLMPATGTPEPGGLSWPQALSVLHSIAAQRRIIGFDVVELAPITGWHAADFTAAKLVYTMMGCVIGSGMSAI